MTTRAPTPVTRAGTRATKKPLDVMLAIAGPDHYAVSVPGFDAIQCVESQWADSKLPHAAINGHAVAIDYEDGPTIATPPTCACVINAFATTTKQLAAQARAAGIQQLVLYSPLPIFSADADYPALNKALAKANPLDGYDLLALPYEIDITNVAWMVAQPAGVRKQVDRLVTAGKVYGKPMALWISMFTVNGSPDVLVPDSLLQTLVDAAAANSIALIGWADVDDVNQAAAFGAKLKGMAAK